MKKIVIKDIFRKSWNTFKEQWGLLIGVLVIVFGLEFAFGALDAMLQSQESMIASILIIIISVFVGVIIQIGVTEMLLKLSKGQSAKLLDMIGDYTLAVTFFVGGIVYGLIVLVGLLLFIVPGVVWAIKYSQWRFLVIEKRMGVFESLRESGKITQGSKMDLFVFGLALFGIFILSVIPLGLGLVISVPFSMLASVYVYRVLVDTPQTERAPSETGDVSELPQMEQMEN
jgi:uncharacterized membrane protein